MTTTTTQPVKKPRTRKPHQHAKGRPYENLLGLERLTDEGEWIADDGQEGVAFSGYTESRCRTAKTPYAFAAKCPCDSSRDHNVREACPFRKAMDRTSKKHGVANGRRFIQPV